MRCVLCTVFMQHQCDLYTCLPEYVVHNRISHNATRLTSRFQCDLGETSQDLISFFGSLFDQTVRRLDVCARNWRINEK